MATAVSGGEGFMATAVGGGEGVGGDGVVGALLSEFESELAALEALRSTSAEEERARIDAAAAALDAAGGVANVKTRRIVENLCRQFKAFVAKHGEYYEYDAAVGPTVEFALQFQRYGFFNRDTYSTLGLDGLSDAWGEDQVPFYLAKFAFPMMKLPGWVGLDKEALYIRHRPYAQALRANWRALKTQGFRGGQGNDRSLVKERWCDGLMFVAQDACRREVLRVNRAVTRLAVIAHVKATCSRSGGFSKDWADTSGDSLAWLGRHVLCVSDFTWAPKYMELQKLVVASSSAPARACGPPPRPRSFFWRRPAARGRLLSFHQ